MSSVKYYNSTEHPNKLFSTIVTDTNFASTATKLIVYDVLGQEIVTLVNHKQPPGNYQTVFDASNLSSGIYYYQLKAGQFLETHKMILIK